MAWRWETRGNNEYLYVAHRVNGRVVKTYLAKNGAMRQAMNVLMLDRQERDRKDREAKRRASVELRARVADVLRQLADADAELRQAAEALLISVGFHRLNRGRWKMKRKPLPATKGTRQQDATRSSADVPMVPYHGTPPSAPEPLIHYRPLTGWLDGADDLFAAARAGDGDAQATLRKELRANEWARDFFGDLGNRATRTIIARAGGGDPVWVIAIEERVRTMTKELLGDTPTVLDQLIVRRIVNAWVTVHSLELELAIRPPSRPRDRAYLEAAAERASRKMMQAIGELARVRRLHLPPTIMVNVTPPTPPPPPPRVATAEVLETGEKAALVKGPGGRRLSSKRKTG